MKREYLLAFFFMCASVLAQNIKVKLEPVWEIGGEKNKSKEYFFKVPGQLIADQQGNVYEVENNGVEINKFDKNGKFIKVIGRNGSGPGEFKHIEDVFVNRDNHLVVKDQINGRISYMTTDGKYLGGEKLTIAAIKMFRSGAFDDENVIGQLKINTEKPEEGNKFVIYDKGLKNKLTSFGHSSIFWKNETAEDIVESKMCDLKYAVYQKSKVFVTKEFCDGRVYLFDKNKNWDLKILNGNKFSMRPVEFYEGIKGSARTELIKKMHLSAVTSGININGTRRIFTLLLRRVSMGLFIYKDKYLLNFISAQKKQNDVELGIDVFDLEGNYKGFFRFEGINLWLSSTAICQDGEGGFIISAFDGDYPVLKKFRLIIN